MKKIWLFLLLTVLSAALLTGCASTADTLPTPTPGASGMPGTPMQDQNALDASPMPASSAAPWL